MELRLPPNITKFERDDFQFMVYVNLPHQLLPVLVSAGHNALNESVAKMCFLSQMELIMNVSGNIF